MDENELPCAAPPRPSWWHAQHNASCVCLYAVYGKYVSGCTKKEKLNIKELMAHGGWSVQEPKKKNPIFMVILFRFLNACTMFVYTTVHIWHGDTHTGDIATNRYLHKKSLYVAAVIQTHIFGQINRRNVNFWADDGVVTFCSTHHHMHKPQTGTFANWFHFVRACGKCFFFPSSLFVTLIVFWYKCIETDGCRVYTNKLKRKLNIFSGFSVVIC